MVTGETMTTLSAIVSWLTNIALLLSVAGIVLAVMLFLVSGGGEGRLKSASRILTSSVIGIMVALLSFALVWVLNRLELFSSLQKLDFLV